MFVLRVPTNNVALANVYRPVARKCEVGGKNSQMGERKEAREAAQLGGCGSRTIFQLENSEIAIWQLPAV